MYSVDRYTGRAPVQRQVDRQVQRELAPVAVAKQLAEGKMAASREVGAYGTASVAHLRNILREIELSNPDAAPEAAAIVRITNSSIIAAVIEFGAGL